MHFNGAILLGSSFVSGKFSDASFVGFNGTNDCLLDDKTLQAAHCAVHNHHQKTSYSANKHLVLWTLDHLMAIAWHFISVCSSGC